jgi:hypothetical protein
MRSCSSQGAFLHCCCCSPSVTYISYSCIILATHYGVRTCTAAAAALCQGPKRYLLLITGCVLALLLLLSVSDLYVTCSSLRGAYLRCCCCCSPVTYMLLALHYGVRTCALLLSVSDLYVACSSLRDAHLHCCCFPVSCVPEILALSLASSELTIRACF